MNKCATLAPIAPSRRVKILALDFFVVFSLDVQRRRLRLSWHNGMLVKSLLLLDYVLL